MVNPAAVEVFKLVSTLVVSSGVSTMVGFAAKNSVPKVAPFLIRSRPLLSGAFHAFQKIAIPAGAAALAGMAAEQAVKYTEKEIDETVVVIDKYKAKIDKIRKDSKTEDSKTETPESE